MQRKFLKDMISIIAGIPGENIVDILDEKKYVNEFLIAKKLDITVNQVRNVLYKLSDQGIVSYIKKKDKRKGWYTFFWKLENLRTLELLESFFLKKIQDYQNQIKSRENKLFYVCNRCNIELTEETALAYNFICQECGSVFDIKDNSKLIKDLRRGLERTESDLAELKEELAKEKLKADKVVAKKIKVAEKDKIKEREVKKKERQKRLAIEKSMKESKSKDKSKKRKHKFSRSKFKSHTAHAPNKKLNKSKKKKKR